MAKALLSWFLMHTRVRNNCRIALGRRPTTTMQSPPASSLSELSMRMEILRKITCHLAPLTLTGASVAALVWSLEGAHTRRSSLSAALIARLC